MDGIQAAVLSVKLRRLENGNLLRRAHAVEYNRALSSIEEVVTPIEADYARHVYHIYAIRVHDRDEVMFALNEKGIQTGVHYPVPVHLQRAYRELGYTAGDFPITEQTALEYISLPMFPELTTEQIGMVTLALREAVTSGVMA
jgi:dTDP-4-amino-4,6-dideoxygalactose transaminase